MSLRLLAIEEHVCGPVGALNERTGRQIMSLRLLAIQKRFANQQEH